ncbi:hypothetical protein COHA_005474 [Chlorella ohadii]|uniref:XPA C-terminal domain-containing protein n=1 Tax=Chlorella ohadii TaxID=2649997 RepID=A0AAD5H4Q6_9CHLO|nr:hypothetical protein COHA_005474 [Chlorella ohadii]
MDAAVSELLSFAVLFAGRAFNYSLLQSTAKQSYSVSDGDLAKLGSLRKSNPHKADWTPMQLFLESQVARLAHDKFGGAEQLQEHQRARADAKLQSKLRRREEEKAKEKKEAARLARIRQRIEGERAAAQGGGAAAEASEEEEI